MKTIIIKLELEAECGKYLCKECRHKATLNNDKGEWYCHVFNAVLENTKKYNMPKRLDLCKKYEVTQ